MTYNLEDVIDKVNEMGENVGLAGGLAIEDGEDLYSFITFLDNTLTNAIKENKELIAENVKLKNELYDYRKKYGGV